MAEDIPLDIRYEDDHMIVLSKPAGSWSTRRRDTGPARSSTRYSRTPTTSARLRARTGPGIVHRLDKDTLGLMMVAKSDEAQVAAPGGDQDQVDRPPLPDARARLHRARHRADRRAARPRPEGPHAHGGLGPTDAKQAVTTFRVLERFEAGQFDDGFTLVECKLYTGRTHQIRVHMAYIATRASATSSTVRAS